MDEFCITHISMLGIILLLILLLTISLFTESKWLFLTYEYYIGIKIKI